MVHTPTIFAIVPAAGRSRRMGTAKSLLPVAGRPMLLHILDTLRAGGAHHIALVTNSNLLAALPELPDDVRVVINDSPDTEMIDSIRLGLDAYLKGVTMPPPPGTPGEGGGEGSDVPPQQVSLNRTTGASPVPTPPARAKRPSHGDGFLICPCDAAGLTPDDIQRCIEAFHESPDRIIIAAHNNRRGHPIIFPAALTDAVFSKECDAGLNQLTHNRPHLRRLIECSPGTTQNINTPADYASDLSKDAPSSI